MDGDQRPRAPRRGLEVSVIGAAETGAAARGLGRWLAGAAPARARGTVAIALVSDAAMRRLNRQYRGADYGTDVLSFPASDPETEDGRSSMRPGRARSGPAAEARHLGDLAIARGVAARQARERGHALRTELRILALHGLLHLLGYDHDADTGQMQRVEERLRRRAGLPTGLIRRASTRAARR